MPAKKSKESCRSKWNFSKIHCSILHALLPKCGETFEGRSGLVGPESHGRGGLSEKKYTGATIESYESRTAHFLYLLRIQGEQLTAQRVRHHTGWLVHWPYRNRAEKYDPSIITPHISWHAERGISFYKVSITSNQKIHSLFYESSTIQRVHCLFEWRREGLCIDTLEPCSSP